MNINLDYYKKACEVAGLPKGKLSKEYLFTPYVVDLFYFEKNIGVTNIQDGFIDGANDGGIDFILSNDDSMILVQGKSTENLSYEEIINAIDKIIRTINDFSNNKLSSYSSKLKSAFIETKDSVSDDSTIHIDLFTNTNIDIKIMDKLLELFSEEPYSNYDCNIYGKKEIEYKIIELANNSEYVKEDSLFLSETKNQLKYNDSYIVNIKASSLQKLYLKYGRKGLFNYNLREYINSEKYVDNGIEDTIKRERENFWFYNNGITIICNGCRIDGNKVVLYDFSIINGAQTTSKIGKSDSINPQNDFSLVCKIVVVSEGSLRDNDKFISKISEASNSQKPIKPRDLKSNSFEQKQLQYGASQNGKKSLAIEIKRGLDPNNKNKVEKQYQIKNEDIGQLILACILQCPGTARNGKRKIFNTPLYYNKIFKRKMDFDTLFDLVKLSNYYDKFRVNYIKEEENLDLVAVAKNGKYIILAIIIYLLKVEKNIIIDYRDENLDEDNFSGAIFSSVDDIETILFDMFKFLTWNLKNIYKIKKADMKLTSVSNFFKSDNNYKSIILEMFHKDVLNDSYNQKRIEDYMNIFM